MIAKSFLLGLLLSLSLLASAGTVPSLLSYQGRVTDADGALIGEGGPVNRTVTFRFHAASSGGDALYAESQVVTISEGEFSVLIGNGTGVSNSPGPSSPALTPYKTLGDIVNDASVAALYLGITVDDGNPGTTDAEISPRQQLVSGAYSLRAKVAEAVASEAISADMIADGAIGTNQIYSSSVTSAKIADGAVATADLGNNVVTSAKLDATTVGFWTPHGSDVYRNGKVGIGSANPQFSLDFGSAALGERINLYGTTSSNFGFGIQSQLLQIHTSSASSDIAFGYGTSASMTETMRVKGNGNVGIGTASPLAKLDIGGTVLLNGTAGRNYFKDAEKSDGNGLRVGAAWGKYGVYAESGAGVLGGEAGASLQNDALFVGANRNVGIGNTSPGVPLSFANALGDKIALYGSTDSAKYGFGIQGGTLQIFSSDINSKVAIGRGSSNAMTEVLRVYGDGKVSINTTNTGQGTLNVDGPVVAIGSNNGSPGYARMYYENGGRVVFDVYNTYLYNGQWRGFSYDGDSNLDWRSDARLKENVEDAEPMLDRLMQVEFRRYNWIGSEDRHKEFGVIAQELQPHFPDLVGKGADGMFTVGYTSFGNIAAKAVQELKQRTDADFEVLADEIVSAERRLMDELEAKDAKIADLEARLAVLERLLAPAN